MNRRLVILAWRDKNNPESGGAEEYIVNIAERLIKYGYTVTMLTAGYKNAPKTETINSIEYHRIGNQYTQYLLIPLTFLTNFRSKTDVLIENFNAWPYLTPILFKRNVTIVHHLQSNEWVNRFGKVIGSIFLFLSRVLLNLYKNAQIITVSPSSMAELVHHGFNPNKITIIHNGTDERFFETPPLLNNTTSPIHLLFMGRQVRTKRTMLGLTLLSQYKKLHHTAPIQVDVIGAGEALPEIIAFAKTANFPITCHGRISDAEKVVIAEKAHLHLQLSEKEGWGITTIEAATKGVPTLCLDVPGLRDSVSSQTGYIAKNDKDLINTLETAIADILANDQTYQQKRVAAYNWSKQFTWQQSAENFDKLLQNLT